MIDFEVEDRPQKQQKACSVCCKPFAYSQILDLNLEMYYNCTTSIQTFLNRLHRISYPYPRK